MEEIKEIKINIPEGYEIDVENSIFTCIKFKKKVEINTWKDIKHINGCFINNFSEIRQLETSISKDRGDKNVFISEKYAKSALALAQISQLMPYYGGEITEEEWKDGSCKYSITIDNGTIYKINTVYMKEMITFHTAEQRNKFLSFPENVQLVKDLYMD